MGSNLIRERVGILGGSFNPAHDGHLHIATLALERLALDRVWWTVSPQNPLKSVETMAEFEERFTFACKIASIEPRIIVTDIERQLDKQFTAETLPAIVSEYPESQFIWIMGADNLAQIVLWENWSKIFDTVPIAVFARPPYDSKILSCPAAVKFADQRLDERLGVTLVEMSPPAWIYFDTPLNSASATQIRFECDFESSCKNP